MKERTGNQSGTIRTSVSLPVDLSQTIDAIAKKKKVSRAWIVRDALESYIREKWPLLESKV
jgi:metal-responsive CopG/Arc/MetJ family transcriptional regulator